MYQNIIIIAISLLADFYYYFTYTNKLVSDFYKVYVKDSEKVFVKKCTLKNDKDEEVETELYIDSVNETETLLKISEGSTPSTSNNNNKRKYNSAEIMTLLWYGNGDLIKNGKCFNKDFTVLLVLVIIADLNREGVIDFAKYNNNDKPILLCMDKRKSGISYYDLCIDLFEEKNNIPLHVFVNKAVLYGLQLRNMVIEDLEKKGLAERVVKEYFKGKVKCNYWVLHMPIECQGWFRDYVFKDFRNDVSIKTLIDLMILSSEILYQKDRLFKNIFGKNEFYYMKKKFTEGIDLPSVYVISDENISKENKGFDKINGKPIDAETDITIGNDI
ncbi:hypothetical protein H8356DRAFT_1298081 [Neocallimastix lanati (nom. inval.)]|uniref:Uncharacterized protein n=1 Tax=Neocallimastix californiae TaxID=1754190 RepID=A0A1Y1ZA79_9FUNG|nr:hypothetical protein H8356DRAFT_1298081 [Neocallimastix sp. JGI-2020a]ORY07180.1 hypothetical protein LY90DRAFT_678298 [Neocallimastix californiae]|eukprot:ORY07180.1 hypothetical protein LY90DRAFT_678298 [Neocallimastix californiae]